MITISRDFCTRQCSKCGHGEHAGGCGVGTDYAYITNDGRIGKQVLCECKGEHIFEMWPIAKRAILGKLYSWDWDCSHIGYCYTTHSNMVKSV